MMIGIDTLGIGNKNFKTKELIAALRVYGRPVALGAFDTGWHGAFGDPRANLSAVIAACPNVTALRIQGFWGGASHALVPQNVTAARVPLWQKFWENHPQIEKMFYSFSCEYNSRNVAELKKRVAAVKTLSKMIPVCCPMGGSAYVLGEVSEEHGKNASCGPNQIASWDGNSCFDYDAESWMQRNSGAIICFLWGDLCNMAESHNTLSPDRRTESPSKEYYLGMLRLSEPAGTPPAPTFTGKVAPIVRPFLYKNFAEDMQGQNTRDAKPLLICNAGAPHADVITFDGQKLGTFPIFGKPGDYPGRLTRYYAGLPGGLNACGYEIAAFCKQKSGTEWGFFRVGNSYFGPVNFAFRRGFFQD